VNPVPDPLLFRKCGSAGNLNPDLFSDFVPLNPPLAGLLTYGLLGCGILLALLSENLFIQSSNSAIISILMRHSQFGSFEGLFASPPDLP
jgi:hypothetical protein